MRLRQNLSFLGIYYAPEAWLLRTGVCTRCAFCSPYAVADFTAPWGWPVVIAPDSAAQESELKLLVTHPHLRFLRMKFQALLTMSVRLRLAVQPRTC